MFFKYKKNLVELELTLGHAKIMKRCKLFYWNNYFSNKHLYSLQLLKTKSFRWNIVQMLQLTTSFLETVYIHITIYKSYFMFRYILNKLLIIFQKEVAMGISQYLNMQVPGKWKCGHDYDVYFYYFYFIYLFEHASSW